MNSSAVALDQFADRLERYSNWRDRLADAINSYQDWLRAQGKSDSDDELRMYELVESLRSDKISIALVGEFSRGKTELINAIFFADYQRRLLPSAPGRTTMCPTEISWNPNEEPHIRLLPIETRKSSLTIAEYRKAPVNWTTLALNTDSADDMAAVLQEIIKGKTLSVKEAKELGLLSAAQDACDDRGNTSGLVEIPVWRHAIVNYPHRLLKQGLVILDTPGLNALGAEPELTLSMLPNAHAVLFVLAADTGVTKSDLEIWRNHVNTTGSHAVDSSRIAALNKIDTLWDELRTEANIAADIDRQVHETTRILGIDRSNVFPVSAHKGLLGKVRKDLDLLQRSQLPLLEAKLSDDIIACKQKIVRDKVVLEIGSMVQSSRELLHNKIKAVQSELNEIKQLQGKNTNIIADMSIKLRNQRDIYDREVESFQATRDHLSEQIRQLMKLLDMKQFDRLIKQTRHAMHNSWSTKGLRTGMETFFEGASKNMKAVETRANDIRDLVIRTYQRFHKEHGLPQMKPVSFSVTGFVKQFSKLESEAKTFRTSTTMVMTEQHFVIKKFFITLVSRARDITNDCNTAARNWAKAVLTPIYTQIQEHRIMIQRRLDNLEKMRTNHKSLSQRVLELDDELADLKQKAQVIKEILTRIHEPDEATNLN